MVAKRLPKSSTRESKLSIWTNIMIQFVVTKQPAVARRWRANVVIHMYMMAYTCTCTLSYNSKKTERQFLLFLLSPIYTSLWKQEAKKKH